jgi:hypothetical protein
VSAIDDRLIAYHRKQRGWGMALNTCQLVLHRLIEDGHPNPEEALRKEIEQAIAFRGEG